MTALCAATLPETREQVGIKLGFAKPSLCRLFNKHGAEIDHLDLVMHNDLLYASAGGPFPRLVKERPSSHGMCLPFVTWLQLFSCLLSVVRQIRR